MYRHCHSVRRRVFVVEFCAGRPPQTRRFHLCVSAGGNLLQFLLASHETQTHHPKHHWNFLQLTQTESADSLESCHQHTRNFLFRNSCVVDSAVEKWDWSRVHQHVHNQKQCFLNNSKLCTSTPGGLIRAGTMVQPWKIHDILCCNNHYMLHDTIRLLWHFSKNKLKSN